MLFAVAWPTQILLRVGDENVQHLPTHLYRLKELQFRSSANVGKLEYYLNVIITRFTLTQSGDTWLSSSWGYQMISFQVRLSSSAMQGNESRNWSGNRWAGGKYFLHLATSAAEPDSKVLTKLSLGTLWGMPTVVNLWPSNSLVILTVILARAHFIFRMCCC